MYFKQRESSALYLHYQKQEHQRLAKKIESIKTRKQKHVNSSENLLPPITHRPSQIRIYQKRLLVAETDRLNKKLNEVKNHRSQYFQKVIGVNLSLDLSKIHRTLPLQNEKHLSTLSDSQSHKNQPPAEKQQ